MDNKFNVTIPAEIVKSEDGEWRIHGLASTETIDQQGEIVLQEGLDLSPIEKGRGVFNFDHNKGPENTVGIIDSWQKGSNGLELGGYLFKNHDKAKAIYGIMSSLKDQDRGRIGLSIEGAIQRREGPSGKVISKAKINACAITLNPVNQETYADIAKSLGYENVDFSENITYMEGPDLEFDVDSKLEKALGVSGAAIAESTPAERTGGEALAVEDLDKDKKKKKFKKMSKELYKSSMLDILEKLQILYPSCSRSQIWESVKDRINAKFDTINIEND